MFSVLSGTISTLWSLFTFATASVRQLIEPIGGVWPISDADTLPEEVDVPTFCNPTFCKCSFQLSILTNKDAFKLGV